jgi:uncharacterized protein with GYD domain
MATYLFQFSYAVDAVKGMVAKPQNRREAAEKVIAAAGGQLLDMYFCFGDYDGVATAEFPSNVDAAAASLAAFQRVSSLAHSNEVELLLCLRGNLDRLEVGRYKLTIRRKQLLSCYGLEETL